MTKTIQNIGKSGKSTKTDDAMVLKEIELGAVQMCVTHKCKSYRYRKILNEMLYVENKLAKYEPQIKIDYGCYR